MDSDLKTLVTAVQGERLMGEPSQKFKGVSINSRTVKPDELFFCLLFALIITLAKPGLFLFSTVNKCARKRKNKNRYTNNKKSANTKQLTFHLTPHYFT